jgi:hypothetical protein
LEELRDASLEQIARVPGVGLLAAQTIKDQLVLSSTGRNP